MTRYLSPPATTFSSPFPPEIGHGFHLHPHRRSYLFVLVGDWLRWGSTKNSDSFLQALLRRALVQGKHWFFIFFSFISKMFGVKSAVVLISIWEIVNWSCGRRLWFIRRLMILLFSGSKNCKLTCTWLIASLSIIFCLFSY